MHFETDCSATTRYQGVKSKHGNNKNYLCLYRMLGHSAIEIHNVDGYTRSRQSIFTADNSNASERLAMKFTDRCCDPLLLRSENKRPERGSLFIHMSLSTSIDKLLTKDAHFKCYDALNGTKVAWKMRMAKITNRFQFFIQTNMVNLRKIKRFFELLNLRRISITLSTSRLLYCILF